jgi:Arc/MetJ-type ribon-helix-helix transcriptional regulator
MPTLAIAIPDNLQRFIDQRVAEGGFADATAYLLSLLEVDQRFQAQEHHRLKAQVEEGLKQLDRGEYFEYETAQQILEDVIGRGEERIDRIRPKSA